MSYDTLIETINYRGIDIEVHYDTDAQSPDDWGNDDAFLVHDHRDFQVTRSGFDPSEIFEHLNTGKKTYDGYWAFPVYAYIHSGVSLSLGRDSYPFTCQWDTSFAGFVLVKRQKGWTWQEDKARKVALSIIEEWNQYLSGQVYGYTSEVDSCWGFYGDKDEMVKEVKSIIDHHIIRENKEAIAKHITRLKNWLLNKVPAIYRQPLVLPY